jgi:hypothetical protein
MAFTEAQLVAQLDPASTGRTITIADMVVGATVTDVYVVGVTAPYAGRSRWVQVLSSLTPVQAATAIQNGLS